MKSNTEIISEIQQMFYKAGFQWHEHIFNDGDDNANCYIEFTKDKSPHALSSYPRPKDCVGWGRFNRYHAWTMAGDWLVKKMLD